MALTDSFLKIDGVPGESMDAKHRDEIQVLSWNWGASQEGTGHEGGGSGAGKVAMLDFTFMMNTNKASPKLFQMCALGEHIKQAALTVRKAGKDQQDYYRITFTQVLVSNVFQSLDKVDEKTNLPREVVSLNFAKYEVEYFPQKADGSLGAATKVKYDLKAMSYA